MALVGGSLGCVMALDFALAYPDAVEKLVLIDAQVSRLETISRCSISG
jgi:pimeloyl-ACP methyl ester carboxylesterase